MPGTNVWSVVFVVVAAIVAVLLLTPLVNMWRRYVRNADILRKAEIESFSWLGPAVITIGIIGIYALAVTLGWNAMVNTTASTEVKQKNPAAIQEQKKVQESQLPSSEELNKARAEQKEVQQVKPHKEALDSFDESMKREAEKIRQRSLNESASPEKK